MSDFLKVTEENKLDIIFNAGQKEAIDKAVCWYKDYRDHKKVKPYFFLAGFAGTGKTTVARTIANLCVRPFQSQFIAPTGKAASRLKQKGCDNAKTIHQFNYTLVGQDENEIDRKDKLLFVTKSVIEGKTKLIILDEASMCSKTTFDDLLSRKIPILCLGDLGQLPPIDAESYFIEENCDYNLDEIVRNTGNIVRAAFYIRNGKRLPIRDYDDVKVKLGFPKNDEIKNFIDSNSVILCSYNSTREKINKKAREILNYTDKMPKRGEKLICTFNQHKNNIMNGEQIILGSFSDIPDHEIKATKDSEFMKYIHFKSLTNYQYCTAICNILSFIGNDEQREEARRMTGGFDFGYALTIHKSQGSEWKNVLVVEEFLRNSPYEKLMYTAVTRAIENLVVYRKIKK